MEKPTRLVRYSSSKGWLSVVEESKLNRDSGFQRKATVQGIRSSKLSEPRLFHSPAKLAPTSARALNSSLRPIEPPRLNPASSVPLR